MFAKKAPILDVVKELIAQDEDYVSDHDIDLDGITLIYRNKAIDEDDTPGSLGIKSREIIHGRYDETIKIEFVSSERTSTRQIVKINPEEWSKIRMKEVFDKYTEKVGSGAAGTDSREFSWRGFPLLSSIDMTTPSSLGLKEGDEIYVSNTVKDNEGVYTTSSNSKNSKAKNKSKNKRKSNKGNKKRGKKRYEPSYLWREKWGFLMGGDINAEDKGETTCNHGCETEELEQDHIVSKFIDTFLDVLLMHKKEETGGSNDPSLVKAMRASYDAEEEVWLYERHRKMAIRVLIKMGTNAVLANKNIVQIAQAIIHLENFQKGHKLRFGDMKHKTMVKLEKLVNGRERELLHFYNKRISCTCLSDRYAAVKALQAKVGVCSFCKKTVDRSVLMTCSLCQFGDYCSRSCQVSDWPSHKGLCEMKKGNEDVILSIYDPEEEN